MYEVFKALTEEIRSYKQGEDKVKWIQEKVRHVEDLKDLLEADCLFEEEWQIALDAYLMMQKGDRRLKILELAKRIEKEDD